MVARYPAGIIMVTTAKCSEDQIHFNSYFGTEYQSNNQTHMIWASLCRKILCEVMCNVSKCGVLYISKLTVKPVLSRRNPGDPNQFLQSACLRGVAGYSWAGATLEDFQRVNISMVMFITTLMTLRLKLFTGHCEHCIVSFIRGNGKIDSKLWERKGRKVQSKGQCNIFFISYWPSEA